MSSPASRSWGVLALLLALGTFAFVLQSVGAAQDKPAPEAPSCKFCQSTGRQPCTEHPKTECESEDEVLYCSMIVDCAVCAGTGFMVCEECKSDIARSALEKKKGEIAKYRIKNEGLDKKMNRALPKVETKHFILVFDLERIKVDKKFINQHEGLHLYAKRLEQLYDDYVARQMLGDKDFREKFKVFIWWLPKDHEEGALAFCGQNAKGGVKLMGGTPAYSVCGNKQNFQDDEKLHRNIVHSVTHLMLSAQQSPAWIGNIKGGWLDEGLAHWFEDRYWGICDNYCYQEQNSNVDFKSGKYRLAIRKLVEADKVPSAAQIFERNTDTLTLPEHAAAFSYVDYFLSRDGEKFKQLVAKMKKKVPTRDAMKEIYGFGPIEFEGLWKAWVLQTYPTK
ncbi:MAG: hypothetical protein SGI72_00155 [Planctomycetota bacterium]|nr:hypothetical protein [Planctomycetota bacterium]